MSFEENLNIYDYLKFLIGGGFHLIITHISTDCSASVNIVTWFMVDIAARFCRYYKIKPLLIQLKKELQAPLPNSVPIVRIVNMFLTYSSPRIQINIGAVD